VRQAIACQLLAQVYDSNSPAYAEAYRVFVKCTDQKTRARDRLQDIIDGLEHRTTLIDVGAGDGMFTGWIAAQFSRTVAIEPNRDFAKLFARHLPGARLIEGDLEHSDPATVGDLVLCANVFFHIPRHEWRQSVLRMLRWVAPKGALVLFLQNSETQCMQMLRHFGVNPGSLRELGRELEQASQGRFQMSVDRVSACVETSNQSSGHQVAEFMLNCLPPSNPPTAEEFRTYVDGHFRERSGKFRFSCDLDCLILREVSE
jgi:hypothetical protein